MYEYSIKIQFGKLSGPDALLGFNFARAIPNTLTFKPG